VLEPTVAAEVGRMMRLTTSMGTARRSFHDRRGNPTLPIEVAGKTGTLFYRGRPSDPSLPAAIPGGDHLGYSWFVGFAPADKPTIAFAILLGNPAAWQLRAHSVARQVVADYLATQNSRRAGRLLARR
jgi:cell division protein FtsI/penicillin-binding protein 2